MANVDIVVAYNTQVEMTKEFLERMVVTTASSKHNVRCILVHGYVGDEEDIQHDFVDKFLRIKNEGYCKTLNHGLQNIYKDTDYIFLVGNDSFPREGGWLDKLIEYQKIYNSSIVCPADQTSCVAPILSCVEKIDTVLFYNFYASIAWLIPREVFDKVGLLDESFYGAGYYSDNDYCNRVVQLFGTKSIILCQDVVLDHRTSVEGKGLQLTNQMGELQVIYKNKWG